jgi:membrane-associated phospholipid phosphatase
MDGCETLIYKVGEYGPLLLFLQSLLLLRKREIFLDYYAIGFFLNILLNFILKVIIKEPRPSVDKKTFDLALKYMRDKDYRNALSYDVFGMPSGHAQGAFYSTLFIWFVEKNMNLTLFYLFVSLITLYQRVEYKFHTVLQVILGSLIGTIIGSLVYFMASQKRKGILKEKQEDDGPL